MRTFLSQGGAVFLCVALVGFPVSGETGELVGVAKATGYAKINDQPLPGESNVYSGDWIRTEAEATVTVFLGSQERLYIAPKSRARVMKVEGRTVIALDRGTVAFRSAGATEATIEKFDILVRAKGDGTVIGQVELLNPTQARVSALQGPLEISTPGQSVVLQPGHSATLGTEAAQAPPGSAAPTKEKKIAIWIVVGAGAAAAISIPLALRGGKVSPSVP